MFGAKYKDDNMSGKWCAFARFHLHGYVGQVTAAYSEGKAILRLAGGPKVVIIRHI